jgi:hypothetical protein
MEFIKKNITLIIAISIPILMIIFVAASIYLPGIFIKPKFNFLYSNCDKYSYYNKYYYYVQNGKLTRTEMQKPKDEIYELFREPKLYIYDVIKNESKEISFEEAQNLNLDSNIKSPDGFEIVYGTQGYGFFPFFFWPERDYNTLYLKGHNVNKKLNIQFNKPCHSFDFIGWIR